MPRLSARQAGRVRRQAPLQSRPAYAGRMAHGRPPRRRSARASRPPCSGTSSRRQAMPCSTGAGPRPRDRRTAALATDRHRRGVRHDGRRGRPGRRPTSGCCWPGARAIVPDPSFRWMRVAYPTGFLAVILEGWWRGVHWQGWMALGLAIYLLGKAVKYAAIATLGTRWSFRVLVVPGRRSSRAASTRCCDTPTTSVWPGRSIGIACGCRPRSPVPCLP